MSRAALISLLAVLALPGCSAGSSGGASGEAVGPSGAAADQRNALETQIACRDRVNEMYDRRDRADIYMPASTVNTPFSSNYQPGITSRGLAGQFDYERTRAECERNAGADAPARVAPAPPPPPRGR